MSIEGYDNAKLKSLLNNPNINKYLRGVAEEISNDIKLSMEETSPGITYELSSPTRTHTASRPGDPPNVDKSNLVASIDWFEQKANVMIIHDGQPYGIELEQGTSQVAARPFMRPQFTKWKQKLAQDFKDHQVFL